jgi:hypothetical protein
MTCDSHHCPCALVGASDQRNRVLHGAEATPPGLAGGRLLVDQDGFPGGADAVVQQVSNSWAGRAASRDILDPAGIVPDAALWPVRVKPTSLPPVVHQVPAASQHTHECPICPTLQDGIGLPTGHSEAAALANPLARDSKKARSTIGRGPDVRF